MKQSKEGKKNENKKEVAMLIESKIS